MPPALKRVEAGDRVKVCDISGAREESFWCAVLKREGDDFGLEVNNDLICSELEFGRCDPAGLPHLRGKVV